MTTSTSSPVTPDIDMIRRAWEAIVKPEDVHELRIPKPKDPPTGRPRFYGVQAGWFNDVDALVRAVGDIRGDHAEAVYISVNPADPELLARTNNRIAKNRSTTGDDNIIRLRYLFIDNDAQRLAEIPSTDEEKAAALAERDAMVDLLHDLYGWPAPFMVGDSGNGGALLYRIDLDNTDEHKNLLSHVLTALQAKYPSVDATTFNPSRVMKLPGTVSAKGDGLPHRPWRVSSATFDADAGVVGIEQLEQVAGPAEPPRASSNGHYDGPERAWSIEELLALNNITAVPQQKSYGVAWDLDRCLTSDEHDDGACLIERNSGALVYQCQHNSCQGKDWKFLRESGLIQIPGQTNSTRMILPSGHTVPEPEEVSVTLADFLAYMDEHKYIFAPLRTLWPASSVNARIPPIPTGRLKKDGSKEYDTASTWLDRNQPVEQMAWVPGEDMLIEGRLLDHGGWIERAGVTVFNLYRPPTIKPGDPTEADPWFDHVCLVYPDAAEHLIFWLAHRVQRPQEKINHALVLGGQQGIGKDTLLEPIKHAVGPWNFQEVSPSHLLGRFNGFVKSVVLRVSEARDLGDVDRYKFYDHMKNYTAAPPDVLRCDEKNLREHSVLNVCGAVITTNHKSDGIYLPADDRRHYVAWSDLTKDDFTQSYWSKLYGWYASGGYASVAAYLAQLDLSDFDAKAPPPKTAAFWDIVDANRAPEDAELADALDRLGYPDATTLRHVASKADGDFSEWLRDRKNRRQIPHRMEAAGYVPIRNDAAKDGLWKVSSRRQAVYAKRALSVRDRIAAARKLAEAGR